MLKHVLTTMWVIQHTRALSLHNTYEGLT